MSSPFDIYQQSNRQISAASKALASPTVLAILQLLLISYAGLIAPALPKKAAMWASNPIVQVVVLAVILWTGNRDPATSLALAWAFLTIMHLIGAKDPLVENFDGPQTAIIPGCLNYTVYDLVESFDNDTDALFRAMTFSKVPGSVQLTDDNAGLVATYLINAGYKLKQGSCGPPQ